MKLENALVTATILTRALSLWLSVLPVTGERWELSFFVTSVLWPPDITGLQRDCHIVSLEVVMDLLDASIPFMPRLMQSRLLLNMECAAMGPRWFALTHHVFNALDSSST